MDKEIEAPVPQKVIFDLDSAIEQALEKRSAGISSVVVLVDSAGARAELQSSNEPIDSLLSKAHDSLAKIRETNGTKLGMPGVE